MHGGAYPHRGPLGAALAGMTEVRERYDIVAWKIYTMVPTEEHFYFDDHDKSRPQIGQRFIDHVREIGPKIICTHKGISSIVGSTPELADPSDIGPAAKRNPDVDFVVYHSGFEPGSGGVGPYDTNDPGAAGRRPPHPFAASRPASSRTATCTRSSAERGGSSCAIPTAAAHVLGKLLKFVGEERVLWGTDSIWFGTPQDQIQAMRTFQICEALQEAARLSEAHARDQGRDLRAQRGRALRHRTDRRQLRSESADIEKIRATLPPARTYGPETVAEAARMIAAHQAGYML